MSSLTPLGATEKALTHQCERVLTVHFASDMCLAMASRSTAVRTPSEAELARLVSGKDWLFFVAAQNPEASALSILFAYEESGAKARYRTGFVPFQVQRIVEAVRDGGDAMARHAEQEEREAREEAALDRCDNWHDWARIYIEAHPDDNAHDLDTAMALYGYERLGPPLGRDAIRVLLLELGAAGMNAKKLASERKEAAMYASKAEERVLARLAELRKKLGPKPPWSVGSAHRFTIDAAALEQAIALRSGERTGALPSMALEHEPLSELTQKVFTELALPPELRDLLARFSYQRDIGCGELKLQRVNRMVFDNLDDENHFVEHGLFQVGTDSSGDAWLVDLHTFSVGFISHERNHDAEVDPRSEWTDLQLDLGTCLLKSAQESS